MSKRILPEIDKQHNYVGPNNYDFPNYDTTRAERKIQLYFNNKGDLLILAWAGERYVFWTSLTKVDDMELNGQIFHHIAYDELEYVNYLPRALAALDMDCSSLLEFYRVELLQIPEPKRNKQIPRTLTTPFGHLYEKEQQELSSRLFAEDVRGFGDSLRARCELRECGGSYEAVLKGYADALEKAEVYDDRVRMLEEILNGESYLCLSAKEEIRKPYLYCRKRCEELRRTQNK